MDDVDDWIYSPPTDPLEILHKDADLIVVNKPSGLLSVPGRRPEHRDSVFSRLEQTVDELWIAHRLDMDTSGVMLYPRTKAAERELHRQFRERAVKKTYLARVSGHIAQDEGVIDLPLLRLKVRPPRTIVSEEDGKPSTTGYKVLSRRSDETTLVALYPITGRSHQLRVHLLELGHPILGDRFYAPPAEMDRASRLLLHAATIEFAHPRSGEKMRSDAPPPMELEGGAMRRVHSSG
ncbi:MAG: RluA family pseudouridine synthase [Myxococcota bacterium]